MGLGSSAGLGSLWGLDFCGCGSLWGWFSLGLGSLRSLVYMN